METSIAQMADQLTVKFVELQERYPCNEDIECKYVLNSYKVQDGDRIAIFRMGWKSLRNYVLFEWAVESSLSKTNSVIFSRYDLPNSAGDSDDLYQFCYISGENVVQGISTPFQIYTAQSKTKFALDDSLMIDKTMHLTQLLTLKNEEVAKLKEDNAILRESLKSIVDQRRFQGSKTANEPVDELKDLVLKLRDAVVGQQKEIDALKLEMKRDKADRKQLLLDKILAEKRVDALFSKPQARCNFDYKLGDLESIPPFTFDSFVDLHF